MKIYLINPKPDYPCVFGEEYLNSKNILFIADNTTPTVAALIPKDIEVILCEERVDSIDYNTDADWIALTAKLAQNKNLINIAKRFKLLNKKIIVGGSFISRYSDKIKEYADIIVKGEIEDIANELFTDLKANTYKKEYIGTRPKLDKAPTPAWNLYPTEKTWVGSIQFSRGCPFNCDFCDVVQFNGRECRCKTVNQIIRELDYLYNDHNLKNILITDDNVFANIAKAKQIFDAIGKWKGNKNISFSIQAPILIAQYKELLTSMRSAGVETVCLGVESFDFQLLKSIHKSHNRVNSVEDIINHFLSYGISSVIGLIFGFDQHDTSIFNKTYMEGNQLGVPIFSIQALLGYPNTVLYQELKKNNRIENNIEDLVALPWNTNITPKLMTNKELSNGTYEIFKKFYEPLAFQNRVENALSKLIIQHNEKRSFEELAFQTITFISRLSATDRKMCFYLLKKYGKEKGNFVGKFLAFYAQIRYMIETYQPGV